MKQPDLFGGMSEVKEPNLHQGKYQYFRSANNYRKSIDNILKCGTCKFCLKKEYHNKNYYKCELQGDSNSESSDIRLKNVCDKWSK